MEIKHGQHFDHRTIRTLRDFIQEQKCPLGLVISGGQQVQLLDENILAIPAGSQ